MAISIMDSSIQTPGYFQQHKMSSYFILYMKKLDIQLFNTINGIPAKKIQDMAFPAKKITTNGINALIQT